jgi:hypothetical protein
VEDICRVRLGNGKISLKVSMGLLRQGGSLLQFVDKEGHRVALADFAVNLHEEREQLLR